MDDMLSRTMDERLSVCVSNSASASDASDALTDTAVDVTSVANVSNIDEQCRSGGL